PHPGDRGGDLGPGASGPAAPAPPRSVDPPAGGEPRPLAGLLLPGLPRADRTALRPDGLADRLRDRGGRPRLPAVAATMDAPRRAGRGHGADRERRLFREPTLVHERGRAAQAPRLSPARRFQHRLGPEPRASRALARPAGTD